MSIKSFSAYRQNVKCLLPTETGKVDEFNDPIIEYKEHIIYDCMVTNQDPPIDLSGNKYKADRTKGREYKGYLYVPKTCNLDLANAIYIIHGAKYKSFGIPTKIYHSPTDFDRVVMLDREIG